MQRIKNYNEFLTEISKDQHELIQNIIQEVFQLGLNFDVSEIHETSIKILEEIGIFIESSKALEILHALGCNTDCKTKIVKIPGSIISNALSFKYPFTRIYGRSENKFVEISGNNIAFDSADNAGEAVKLAERLMK